MPQPGLKTAGGRGVAVGGGAVAVTISVPGVRVGSVDVGDATCPFPIYGMKTASSTVVGVDACGVIGDGGGFGWDRQAAILSVNNNRPKLKRRIKSVPR